MPSLKGKNILIGISGGIAAYKIPQLIRLLVKEQASVKVIITDSAKEFVTPLTLSVVSKNKVFDSFYSFDNQWNSHIDLALWADALLIAPATMNTIAKMTSGVCDNLLLATYFSAKCPVFFAPAMDLDMYKHPANQRNIETLCSYGNYLIPSGFGELASGLIGEGRMAEPEEIKNILEDFFFEKKEDWQGKKILITAGPTYESIDPVRFIGNFSTGKMGIALANVASQMGAEVVLVLGPTQEKNIRKDIKVISVMNAEQMYNAVHQYFTIVDVAILSAAVADYSPKEKATQKIKKKEDTFSLELTKTKDILASLGAVKKHQKLIGFALETQNEIENAKIKIQKKNLDGIVLNSLNDKGAGFGTDTNKITFITSDFQEIAFDLKPKTEVALDILEQIKKIL
ncbi:MAG: bifunctional phosphopantothenoylcysteine decarboxylase/phosphopantothenate--cysteine ligase CoaBC [Capnocytophaga sp.]|nr:bifunctional phosphopantothenoylcysteine decarboxylase/phosphopantothenate--cysteine ligase CoaBC [Capnocytophaga sp.]